MALSNAYVIVYGQLPDIFNKLAEGQAPDSFTHLHLKDLGFTSSNYRAVIPLLKSLGFLSPDGTPTARYHEYRNKAKSRIVMAEAVREAYQDLFVIKAHPTDADKPLIEGKFKSTHNVSDHVAKLMANTFYALLDLSDLDTVPQQPKETAQIVEEPLPKEQLSHSATLHYNIQVHLPATKDIEVYNAIFKSLREHLID